jgi:hypothetical protein
MPETLVFRDRRRRDLRGRVARVTYPARNAIGDFIEGLPCNVIGHRWREVPDPLRRQAGRKMRFKCSRCFLTGGFTN